MRKINYLRKAAEKNEDSPMIEEWDDGELSDASKAVENRRNLKGTSYLDETGKRFSFIYRAVNADEWLFKPMDYVTMSTKFAHEHAEHNLVVDEEDQHVLSLMVKSELIFNASNPGEYFYDGPEVKGKRHVGKVYQSLRSINMNLGRANRYLNKFSDKGLIPGGLADDSDESDFNPEELAKGIKVEMEHTDDEEVAKEISMDHLYESEDYYKFLSKMEKEMKESE